MTQLDKLREAVKNCGPVKITLGDTGVFESEEHDVVIIHVLSTDLHNLRRKVENAVENTQTFPDYKPHITIAYVKKGKGKEYAEKLNTLKGKEITLDTLTFSDTDRNHVYFPLSKEAHQFLEDEQFAEGRRNHALIKKSKKHFGETDDIHEAGYLHHDGSMLDFSGKRDGGSGGVRAYDHREVNHLLPKGRQSDHAAYGSRTKDMHTFMKSTGAIRLQAHGGELGAHIVGKHTPEQIQHLVRHARTHRYPLSVDVSHKDQTHSRHFDSPNVHEVHNWIESVRSGKKHKAENHDEQYSEKAPHEMRLHEWMKRNPIPKQKKIPQEGTYPVIRTDDNALHVDTHGYGSHVRFAKEHGIPGERIAGGGWLKDGDYREQEMGDSYRYGETSRAKERVAHKRHIREAIKSGKKVHPDVLKDHPNISQHEEVDGGIPSNGSNFQFSENLHSWLKPDGKFVPLTKGKTHAEHAASLGHKSIDGLMKKGWHRVFRMGSEIYTHNEHAAPTEHQKKALSDLAIETHHSRVVHDHGEDQKTIWSEHDQFTENDLLEKFLSQSLANQIQSTQQQIISLKSSELKLPELAQVVQQELRKLDQHLNQGLIHIGYQGAIEGVAEVSHQYEQLPAEQKVQKPTSNSVLPIPSIEGDTPTPPKPPKSPLEALGEPIPPEVRLPDLERAIMTLMRPTAMVGTDWKETAELVKAGAFAITGDITQHQSTEVQLALAEAMSEGHSASEFIETVQEKIFEGRGPLSDSHLENIFRTNTLRQKSNAKERTLKSDLVSDAFPYRAYNATADARTRPHHKALEHLGIDNTNIYNADDPVFLKYRPIWQYNCLPPTALITTKRGKIPIVKLTKQDQVLTHLGRWRNVLAMHSSEGPSELKSIQTNEGITINLTGNHRVFTQRGWINSACLNTEDYIYQVFNISSFNIPSIEIENISEIKNFNNFSMSNNVSTILPRPTEFNTNLQRRDVEVQPIRWSRFIELMLNSKFIQSFRENSLVPSHFSSVENVLTWINQTAIFSSSNQFSSNFWTIENIIPFAILTSCNNSVWSMGIIDFKSLRKSSQSNSIAEKDSSNCPKGKSSNQADISNRLPFSQVITDSSLQTIRVRTELENCSSQISSLTIGLFSNGHLCIPVKVKSVETIQYTNPYVYNITVDEDESYIADEIIIHNCRCNHYGVTVVQAANRGVKEAVEWVDRAKQTAEIEGGSFYQYLNTTKPLFFQMVPPVPFDDESFNDATPAVSQHSENNYSHRHFIDSKGQHNVHTYDSSGNKVASAQFVDKEDHLKVAPGSTVYVEPQHRRKGIATSIYNHIQSLTGKKVKKSTILTPDGSAFENHYFNDAAPAASQHSEVTSSYAHYPVEGIPHGKHQWIFKKDKKEIGEIATVARPDGHHEVSNVVVHREHQKQGHGTNFYKHAHDHAKSLGKKLYISNDRTEDAKALHEKFKAKGILKSDGEIQF